MSQGSAHHGCSKDDASRKVGEGNAADQDVGDVANAGTTDQDVDDEAVEDAAGDDQEDKDEYLPCYIAYSVA